MKLWMSGEIMADVADAYREARKDVVGLFNEKLGGHSYGDAVEGIKLIGIVMDSDDPNYAELSKYHKRGKDVEFRLKIDHGAFRRGTDLERRSLVAQAVLRAVSLIPSVVPTKCDCSRLAADFSAVAGEMGWL